jgi:hypothetical protein
MKHQRDVRPAKGAVFRGDATPFDDEEKVASSRALALAGLSSNGINGRSTYSANALLPEIGRARPSQSRREFDKRTRLLPSRHHDQPGGAGIR